ncbi:MAG: hypothetical protein NTV80_27045, partial [Verrucomicrobia bacterium]|nr:hypothetical protein [Verrucomicrobiota bacterium]
MAAIYGTRKAEARWRLAAFICGGSSGVAHGKMKDASADGFPAYATLTSQGGRCSDTSLPGVPASSTLAVQEAEIDQIVYRLFDFTQDEIALIESALAPIRSTNPNANALPGDRAARS